MKTKWGRTVIVILLILNVLWSILNVTRNDEYGKGFYSNAIVAIVMEPNDASYEELSEKFGWIWGTDGATPKTKIAQIVIHSGSTKYNVPRWVFDDLFDPIATTVNVLNNNNDVTILIEGEDAAGAYSAALFFCGGRFNQRILRVSETPERAVIQSESHLVAPQKRPHPFSH